MFWICGTMDELRLVKRVYQATAEGNMERERERERERESSIRPQRLG